MTRPNSAYALVDEPMRTAADYISEPEFTGIRPRELDFTSGFGLEIARIQALASPFAPAMSALLASFTAGDTAAMQRAFEDLDEAATAFYTIRTLANSAAIRLAAERRRKPRHRG